MATLRERGRPTPSWSTRCPAANVQAKIRDRAEEAAYRRTRGIAGVWRDMTRSTREFAGNIATATTSILRWASITGVLSGLIGAGGLFGIDRLAIGAAGARRSSLGLGAGIGNQSAFNANFGRLVDPQSFLESVAGARFDVNRRVGLLGAGLTAGQIDFGRHGPTLGGPAAEPQKHRRQDESGAVRPGP